MRRVLFICTGNYYRSRFAEAVYNHTALRRGLPTRAFSRGLATWMVYGEAPISSNTVEALAGLGIPLSLTGDKPTPLTEDDLNEADLVIALKEQEHRPMMKTQFPDWEDKITYWHVHDIDYADPSEALPEIRRQVLDIFKTTTLKKPAKSPKKRSLSTPKK